jgi:hypothetical protein
MSLLHREIHVSRAQEAFEERPIAEMTIRPSGLDSAARNVISCGRSTQNIFGVMFAKSGMDKLPSRKHGS